MQTLSAGAATTKPACLTDRSCGEAVNEPTFKADERAREACDWALDQLGLSEAVFCPASADAGFRRYFRLSVGDRSWIVMDAPPATEDCHPYLRVGSLMTAAGLHVPEVRASDLNRGFLLISDLGRRTYLDAIKTNTENLNLLYRDAISALVAWQRASRAGVLPDYDARLFHSELQLFLDWYLGRHLNVRLTTDECAEIRGAFDALVASIGSQPRVYVHRDYMVRNLMVSDPNPGIIDFQDAMWGPIAYDPICLLKDAFVSWPDTCVEDWLAQYHAEASSARLPIPGWSAFRRDCDLTGLQRHLKVLGIFARIRYRDGKPSYLEDTPRFVQYVMQVVTQYRELAPVQKVFERYVLPAVGFQ